MAGPAVNVKQNTAPQGAKKPAAMPIPFARASRWKTLLGFSVPSTTMPAAGAANLGPIEIAPAGYLGFIQMTVNIAASGNAATVAFAADAPFNSISFFQLTNAAGDTIISAIDGYKLFLINKYGFNGDNPPWADPRNDPNYYTVAGAVGAGGSAQFRLCVPLEIDRLDQFCALPNMAANKSYQLQLQLNNTGAVYTTPPTVAPAVTINTLEYYYSQPQKMNGAGVQQEIAPRGVGSVSIWRFESPVVAAGDKKVKILSVGSVIKGVIGVLRNSGGARIETNAYGTAQTAVHQLILNNDPLFYLTDLEMLTQTARQYGYQATSKPTTAPPASGVSFDVANGLDTGVRTWIGFFNDMNGGLQGGHTKRDQWLPTLDTTLLQWEINPIGSAGVTLELLVNEIKPSKASALYFPNIL